MAIQSASCHTKLVRKHSGFIIEQDADVNVKLREV